MSDLAPKLAGSVFVTGANGWIGRRVVATLLGHTAGSPVSSDKAAVHALVLPGDSARDLLKLGAHVVQGDIRDRMAVASFLEGSEGGTVIHLAGVIHPPDNRTRTFFDVNVRGTENVLQVATHRRVRRLVAMSSNSPFGANPSPETMFQEDSPYHPYMSYGRSKRAMEELLIEGCGHSHAPEIVIVRAPWFYGPEQPERQTRFFGMIRSGRFPLVGSGENRRSMTYVDNLADGLLLAACVPDIGGQAYWIADESPYSMQEIIGTVRAVLADDFNLGVSSRQIRVPGIVSDLARLADGALQSLGFYQQELHVLSEMNLTIACSIAKAKRELGYQPRVALREGMKHSIQWCLDRGIGI